jgi:hypothetical protein
MNAVASNSRDLRPDPKPIRYSPQVQSFKGVEEARGWDDVRSGLMTPMVFR